MMFRAVVDVLIVALFGQTKMGKYITLNFPQALDLVLNNPKLHKHYENYVEREFCKVIENYHSQLSYLDFDLRIGNVFCNYVRSAYWESCRVVESLSNINNCGYVHLYELKRCQRLAEKNSNLLDYYTEKLIEELNNQLVELCDDFEYQLSAIESKETDSVPEGFLIDFVKTKAFGKGKIKIKEIWT